MGQHPTEEKEGRGAPGGQTLKNPLAGGSWTGTAPGQAAADCRKEPPSREHPAATMGPPSDLEPAGTPGGKGPSRSGRGQVSCSRSTKTPQRGGLKPLARGSGPTPGPGTLARPAPPAPVL